MLNLLNAQLIEDAKSANLPKQKRQPTYINNNKNN
jgi:predicted transcriptional regulator